MRSFHVSVLFALAAMARLWAQPAAEGLVWVEGGAFKNPRSNYFGKNVTVSGFYLGKHEVTQAQWAKVMGANPSKFRGDDLPVEGVSWYDCIEYCNRRSRVEGLRPCYAVVKRVLDRSNDCEEDHVKWTVELIAGANGYRLPTEAEWEYAASGGQWSGGARYSGGDDLGRVGWFWQNSGEAELAGLWSWQAVEQNRGRTHPVGSRQANELGLHDLSGNVREWCWDWFGELTPGGPDPKGIPRGAARVWRGGGWLGGDFCCEITFRAGYEPHGVGQDQGFRVCRGP